MASGLNFELSRRTHIFHLKVWVLVAIFVGVFIVIILLVLPFCRSRKRSRKANGTLPISQIPAVSKDIEEVRVDQYSAQSYAGRMDFFTLQNKFSDKDSDMLLSCEKDKNADNSSYSGSLTRVEKDGVAELGEKRCHGSMYDSSPLSGLPEFSHLG